MGTVNFPLKGVSSNSLLGEGANKMKILHSKIRVMKGFWNVGIVLKIN